MDDKQPATEIAKINLMAHVSMTAFDTPTLERAFELWDADADAGETVDDSHLPPDVRAKRKAQSLLGYVRQAQDEGGEDDVPNRKPDAPDEERIEDDEAAD